MRPTFQIFVVLAVITSLASPQSPADDMPQSNGTSCSSRNGEWVRKSMYSNIRNFEERPVGLQFLKFKVTWQPLKTDPLGNICTASGQLSVAKGNAYTPVDWFQGVTVFMASGVDNQPDWHNGITQDNSFEDSTILNRDGSFTAKFNIRRAGFDRLRGGKLQFGVSLAQHDPIDDEFQQVIWMSELPVLPQTIQMLDVPEPSDMPAELLLINDAAGWPHRSTVALIRAVNALQKCGKERALHLLTQYAELTGNDALSDESDVIQFIISLLFEPARLSDRVPCPATFYYLGTGNSQQSADWPLSPMACIGDIPFMVGSATSTSGQWPLPTDQIRWARRYGLIRTKPLQPTMSPLRAADILLSSRRFTKLSPNHPLNRTRRNICDQALAMLPDEQPMQSRFGAIDALKAEWQERLKSVQKRNIVWNPDKENFDSKADSTESPNQP